jgi:hypothetical protein
MSRDTIREYLDTLSGKSKWTIASKILLWNPPTREYYYETQRLFELKSKHSTSQRYQKEFCKTFVKETMKEYDIDFMILTHTSINDKSPEKDLLENIDLFNMVFSCMSLSPDIDPILKGFILIAPPDYKAYCFKLMPMIRDSMNTQKVIQELESYMWPSFPNQKIQMIGIGATAPVLLDKTPTSTSNPASSPAPVPAPTSFWTSWIPSSISSFFVSNSS